MSEEKVNLDKEVLQRAVGRVVRKQRELINENRAEVAWNVGTDTSHLGNIERGQTEVGLQILTSLQIYLNFTSEDYIREYDQMINELKTP